MDSTKHLPPCPECGNGEWRTLSGGDSVNDPYPDRRDYAMAGFDLVIAGGSRQLFRRFVSAT